MNNTKMNDGIVVYCSKGNIMFTSTGEIIENKKPLRKHKINKNIVYSIFDEMRELNDSEFWEKILIKFSRNIFPRNFRFVNDILFYKAKTKKHKSECFIDIRDLTKSLENLKNFLKDKGFVSTNETEEKNFIISDGNSVLKSWKDFGKNRSILIYNYINEIKKFYSLDSKSTKKLESTIKLGIAGDIFNSDSIIISNYKIQDIKYLIWDDKNREFYIDIKNIPLKFSKSDKNKVEGNKYKTHTFSNDTFNIKSRESETLDIEKRWEKFLMSYYK